MLSGLKAYSPAQRETLILRVQGAPSNRHGRRVIESIVRRLLRHGLEFQRTGRLGELKIQEIAS